MRNYPHMPTDYRHTDKHLKTGNDSYCSLLQTHKRTDRRTDGQADGQTLPSLLSSSFAVDKYLLDERFGLRMRRMRNQEMFVSHSCSLMHDISKPHAPLAFY